MALVVKDRVQESTATTGTGPLTLAGPVAGFQSFSVIGNGNTTFYCIVNENAWEVGIGTYSTTGPTLARTTVISNSNGNTSPITLVGDSTVFCTYPAETSVNLDADGNVSPLGTISSGVWNGTTIPVAYGGTGVTASSGANSVVLRDASSNVVFNNFVSGATAVNASGGTTVLTVASTRTQILVGSTAHTFQLPNATTLQPAHSFVIVNNSSGVLTVVNSTGATVETIPSGGVTQLGATSIATPAGTWGIYSFLPGTYNFNTSTADFGNANIIDAAWNGTAIGAAYGGTGLTTFTSANNALYSTSASALTAGTLPVPAGGTGQTSFSSGYIPYGDSTAALQSSNLLQFNGSHLQVGGGGSVGGATNPIAAFSQSTNSFIQTYTYNPNTGTSASADFVAYGDLGSDTSGFVDMGYGSSNYADALYTVTGPSEGYLLMSAPVASGKTGNLVYATDSTGTANAHQWYVGGFSQAKSAWKMQLTSTGLQLSDALSTSYGGTGANSRQGGMNALAGSVTSGSYLRGDGNNVVMSAIQAADVPTLNQNTTGSAGSVANAVTFNDSGAGVASGTSFNGSAARTISYNTIGAYAATNPNGYTSNLGTVTSVSGTGTVSGLTLSGTVTSSGNITLGGTLNAVTSAVAGTGVSVSSSTGAVTFSIGQAVATGSSVQFGSFGVGTAPSGTTGEIRATNNITAFFSSDAKLKENIKDVDNALDKVCAIGSKRFDWTNEYLDAHGGQDEYFLRKSDFGVIAQDVQEVFPLAVRTREDGTLAVDYEKLSTLAFGAIKELVKRIEVLEAK